MLTIVAREDRWCPAIICDWCGREIEQGVDGNYCWSDDDETLPLQFIHKECMYAFDEATPAIFWCTAELSALPIYLGRTLGIDRHAGEQSSRFFSGRQRRALYMAAMGRCERCGTVLTRHWHADHQVPWSRGGQTGVVNGQALCGPCNREKSDS